VGAAAEAAEQRAPPRPRHDDSALRRFIASHQRLWLDASGYIYAGSCLWAGLITLNPPGGGVVAACVCA
jgi:hypothetical protein